jgi:hypothetical protein
MHSALSSFPLAVALVAGAAAAQQPAQPQQPQQHVRGDIVSVDGDTVQVKSRDGKEVKLKLAENVRVATVEKTDLDSIGENAFIGTTAVPQSDGSLRAIEVHVFPEAMRGTGEGHRPWDLQPKSTMTNATVAKVDQGGGKSKSTMTNATVANVSKKGGGRKIQLKYPDGEKTVYVPANIPIVKMQPSDKSQLQPGAHLFAIATKGPDGTLVAQRLTVGKDVVPPM